MRLLIATSNPHKLEEIGAVFAQERTATKADAAPTDIELVSLAQLGRAIPEPHEDQPTFEGNAILKARYYAGIAKMLCLADDSGLEIDALGGDPGVRSARYAGLTGPRSVVDPANNQLLLEKLRDVLASKRTARFVCTMALCRGRDQVNAENGDAEVLAVVRGTVEGRILLPEETADPSQPHRGRGTNGFGYDPLFLISERGLTTAELAPADKNAISHRGRAARLMWRQLRHLDPSTVT